MNPIYSVLRRQRPDATDYYYYAVCGPSMYSTARNTKACYWRSGARRVSVSIRAVLSHG